MQVPERDAGVGGPALVNEPRDLNGVLSGEWQDR
jgi:hypothetical protein